MPCVDAKSCNWTCGKVSGKAKGKGMDLRRTDCARGGHGYLSMLSRHDGAVEPGIGWGGNKAFTCSFRGTADEDGVG